MNSIDIEIQQLQARIAELEKIKKESAESEKKQYSELDEESLIDYKFEKLRNLLIKKEEDIEKLKNHSLHRRYYDKDIYIHLKASYDLFRIFDERLERLETIGEKVKNNMFFK